MSVNWPLFWEVARYYAICILVGAVQGFTIVKIAESRQPMQPIEQPQ